MYFTFMNVTRDAPPREREGRTLLPQKNGGRERAGTANAGARLVSPTRFCVPGDYDVNYERRSLKVNASGRALCVRERTRGFQ